ncbi:MAG: hypothetical protein AAF614_01330 [Chloroflexota bacterium]
MFKNDSLAKSSLTLGIASAVFVFGIGICGLLGVAQGWIGLAAIPLLVCGATSAFIGFVGFILGISGLVAKESARATAAIGMLLGCLGMCLFFTFMGLIAQAG